LSEDLEAAYLNGWSGLLPWTSNRVDSNGGWEEVSAAASAFTADPEHAAAVFPGADTGDDAGDTDADTGDDAGDTNEDTGDDAGDSDGDGTGGSNNSAGCFLTTIANGVYR
jgi:hypothetical protein